jgi:hypothetical protein
MTLSLPLELTELILTELGGDLPSLQACALVHTSWVTASQTHLFHTVAVDEVREWNSLVRLLRARSQIRPLIRRLEWTLLQDGALDVGLADPSPTLFPRVAYLQYKNGPLWDALVSSLPSLSTLKLWFPDTNVTVPGLGLSSASPLGKGSLALRKLIVGFVSDIDRTTTLAEWIRFSVSWQSLRSLQIFLPVLKDGPAHRRMYESLTALEELSLGMEVAGNPEFDAGQCCIDDSPREGYLLLSL